MSQRILLMMVVGLSGGCFDLGLYFHCEENSQCHHNGVQGVCEPVGYCSFPDSSCVPTGRRFGPDAPFRNACVPEDCTAMSCGDLGPIADLAGVDLAGADLAGIDLAGVDLTGVDLAPTSGPDMAHPSSSPSPCPLPQLLITVEHLYNGSGGQLIRFTLPAGGSPRACDTLTGTGALDPLAEAVAFLPPNLLAVAGRNSVQVLDPSDDVVTQSWMVDSAIYPLDVAPLQVSPSPAPPLIAVAFGYTGDPGQRYLTELDLYDPNQSNVANTWELAALGGVSMAYSMTVDARDPSKLMLLDDRTSGTPQAMESLDPFTPAVANVFDEPSNFGFLSISSVYVGGFVYNVWAAHNAYNGFYSGKDGGAGPQLIGPTVCSGCNVLHAVPDPNSDGRSAFLLCEGSATNGRVVMHAVYVNSQLNGNCTTVYNGMDLSTDWRLSHLGIAGP
jgi:Pentapeptide repeats (8 copies)